MSKDGTAEGSGEQIPTFNDPFEFAEESDRKSKAIRASLSTPSPARTTKEVQEEKKGRKRISSRAEKSVRRSRSRKKEKKAKRGSRSLRGSRSRGRSKERRRSVRSRSKSKRKAVKLKKRSTKRRVSLDSESGSPRRFETDRGRERFGGRSDKEALADEMGILFNSRSNRPPSRETIEKMAELFEESGFCEMSEIKNASRQLREFFISDLREKKVCLPIIKHCVAVLDFHPCDAKGSSSAKNPVFEEVDIAGVIRSLATSWALAAPSITPDQAMVNFFTRELAIGKAHNPPFTPYITSPINVRPRLPQTADHLQRADSWREKMKRIQSNQEAPFPAWVFLRIRFIFAGEAAAAWSDFGGLAAQISHLLFCAEIATLINTETATLYNKLLAQRLAAAARARNPDRIDYISELTMGNEILKQRAVKEQASDYARRISHNSFGRRDHFQNQNQNSQSSKTDRKGKGGGRGGKNSQKGKGKGNAESAKTPAIQ